MTVNDISEIEFKHRQRVSEMKLSIIYAKEDQTNPLDMFLNTDLSQSYEKFLADLGVSEHNKSRWRDITINWFIASRMNEEQHRRLIGNCPCILFFHDSPHPFNLRQIDMLGVIPQIYFVIKPFHGKYRLGCFYRSTIRSYGPQIPKHFLFDSGQLQNFLLVKAHNGYMTLRQCPPLNRLFETPRQTAINAIVSKYSEKPKQLRGNYKRKSTSL